MTTGGDDDAIEGLGSGPTRNVGGAAGVVGPEAADATTSVDATAQVTGADALDGASAADEAIAAALASGELDAQGALEALVEQTVRAQLPPDAPPETIAQVRADVAALLADDPTVLGLLGHS